MLAGIKEKQIVKKTSGQPMRKSASLVPLRFYKKILLIAERNFEDDKRLTEVCFPEARLHVLFERLKKEDTTTGHQYSVHESDFNLTGVLKNDKLIQLSKEPFDLIIDLSTDSILLNYFLTVVPSGLIAGKLEARNQDLHDLLVESGSGTGNFLTNLTHQIKLLTENGNTKI